MFKRHTELKIASFSFLFFFFATLFACFLLFSVPLICFQTPVIFVTDFEFNFSFTIALSLKKKLKFSLKLLKFYLCIRARVHLTCEGVHTDRSQRTVGFYMGPRDSNSGQHPYPPPPSHLPDAKACFVTWCSKGLSEHSINSPLYSVIDYFNFYFYPPFSFTCELHRNM